VKIFSELDLHFARFMTELSGHDSPEVFLAAALVSRSTREGHICLDLSSIEGRPLTDGELYPIICPGLSHWCRILEAAPVVGKPGDYRPLILDGRSRLYLYRYWEYEKKLADFIRDRTADGVRGEIFLDEIDAQLLRDGLDRLFPPLLDEGTDWQRIASVTSLLNRFSVISGSPGTGKTTTVAKIMALLTEQGKGKVLRIALAAPTGKASARLEEAIKKTREVLNCPASIRAAIPEKATTIHRLLGATDSPYFLHNSENPLHVDMVIVDEASMVDLPLMSKLVQAIPPSARLLLLGDKDQLASVEAGAVLGDICGRGRGLLNTFSREFSEKLKKYAGNDIQVASHGGDTPGICDSLCQLQKNYRFGQESGIGHLGAAVNRGDSVHAIDLLKSGIYRDIQWSELPPRDLLVPALDEKLINGFKDYLQAIDSEGNSECIFDLFDRFRILCALRQGPFGVSALNLLIEQILRRENLIKPDARWYRGRPIMITRNDYNLRLFNGDIGIILPDQNGELYAFFRDASGTWRKFVPSRLPEHETVYAMTVHKSQGSEFERILLLLPDRDSPVLTRELIYTGITRAKEEVTIWGREDVFHTAISRRIVRTSGLHDALWGC